VIGDITMKQCRKCGETKSVSEYQRRQDRGNRGNLDPWCKTCRSAYCRMWWEKRKQQRLAATEQPRSIVPSDPPTTKTCSHCHESKSLSDFYADKRYRLGVSGWCRACKLAHGHGWLERRRKTARVVPAHKTCSTCHERKPSTEFSKAPSAIDLLSSRCKDCRLRCEKTQYNKTKARDQALRKNYGITLDDYDALVVAQAGACAICRATPSYESGTLPLVVDHHHVSGTVRGLLCYGCNTRLAALEDEAFVRAATAYLKTTTEEKLA